MTHLEALAQRPRPAGSGAVLEAQTYCEEHLQSLGFTVTRRRFEYSTLPGRFGAPMLGVIGASLSIAVIHLAAVGDPRAALAGLLMLGTMVLLMIWLGGRWGTRTPLFRAAATNLEAVRGERPTVWLVAHIDSKSQPVSSMVRTLGVILLLVGIVGALRESVHFDESTAILMAAFSIAGGLILAASTVGARSDGAADNASGVAAVLGAAELVHRDTKFGVLITDAEELALAGARAWLIGRTPVTALNCDTIDDQGQLVVFRYRGAGTLADLAAAAARSEDPAATVNRTPPGVLTDSNAFKDAGWKTVTLSRGTFRTFSRIHTVRDDLSHLRGVGIPAAAKVLARLVQELA